MAIIEKVMDIAASLHLSPATLDELKQRDFLKNTSGYGIERMLQIGENRKWIYCQHDRYYCYAKTVKDVLSKNGY